MNKTTNTIKDLDLLLVSIPYSYISEPYLAPALLKSTVESKGFSCTTVDFSMSCFKHVFDNDYQSYLEWNKILPDVFDFGKISIQQSEILEKTLVLFDHLVDEFSPRYLGISVFSEWQQRMAYFLCQRIRLSHPTLPIIIGGMGASAVPISLMTVTRMDYFEKTNTFGHFLIKHKLADHVVVNDGEEELVRILAEGRVVNSFVSNEYDFQHAPLPDYSDYDLDSYLFRDGKRLLVQGSKGCVRRCVFCSEHGNYSKFYYKSGKKLAESLIQLSKKYDVTDFQFTDSLVNGSIREFREFIKVLSDYNHENQKKSIRWQGNYICRSHNSLKDLDFLLIKNSGAHGLTIGAESGSNKVLSDMKKDTTVEDLEYEIGKFREFGINCTLLLMVGFYTETWDDFLDTLRLLKRLRPYFFSGTISSVRLGYGLQIMSESHEWKDVLDENFTYSNVDTFNWSYKPNPELTLKERVRRRTIAQEFCDQLGIPVSFAKEDLLVTDMILNNKISSSDITANAHN